MLVNRSQFSKIGSATLNCGDILLSSCDKILVLTNEIAYFQNELYYYDYYEKDRKYFYFYFKNRYTFEVIRGLIYVDKHIKYH